MTERPASLPSNEMRHSDAPVAACETRIARELSFPLGAASTRSCASPDSLSRLLIPFASGALLAWLVMWGPTFL
jgi:hypothetical protein